MEKQLELKKPLRILMLAPTMFFADYGGHIRILEEALELRRRGHKVTILTYPNGRDIAGLDIRRCLGVPFNYRVVVGSSRHKYYLDVMLTLRALWHIWQEKPDIIHAHMHEGALIGWLLSKLTGAPLVFDFQGSLIGEMLDHHFIRKDSLSYRFFRWLEYRIDRAPSVILTSSRHAVNLLQQAFHVPRGRIHPTPDCVDAVTFDPETVDQATRDLLAKALGLPRDKQIIVYVGLLTPYQGIDLLLQALQRLVKQRDDFHLLLMGFPTPAYRALVEKLGLTSFVTFTEKVPYDTLPGYLALGDLAVAPKLSTTEGLGKILNYMSMALPTVAFATPVSQEYLGQLGIYAAESNAEALAAAIETGLDMPPGERSSLGKQLRSNAENNFSWQKTGRELENVYAAVLAGHPTPASVANRLTI